MQLGTGNLLRYSITKKLIRNNFIIKIEFNFKRHSEQDFPWNISMELVFIHLTMWRYNPGWVLASLMSYQLLIRSKLHASTATHSINPLNQRAVSTTFLGISSSSILVTWPAQLSLPSFMNLTLVYI